jgi:hypothetical protein
VISEEWGVRSKQWGVRSEEWGGVTISSEEWGIKRIEEEEELGLRSEGRRNFSEQWGVKKGGVRSGERWSRERRSK